MLFVHSLAIGSAPDCRLARSPQPSLPLHVPPREALALYVGTIGDLGLAEAYCDRVYAAAVQQHARSAITRSPTRAQAQRRWNGAGVAVGSGSGAGGGEPGAGAGGGGVEGSGGSVGGGTTAGKYLAPGEEAGDIYMDLLEVGGACEGLWGVGGGTGQSGTQCVAVVRGCVLVSLPGHALPSFQGGLSSRPLRHPPSCFCLSIPQAVLHPPPGQGAAKAPPPSWRQLCLLLSRKRDRVRAQQV